MRGIFKVAAALFCVIILAICVHLSARVLTAPSKAIDIGIAKMCDYATLESAEALKELSLYIHSDWWKAYADSRLVLEKLEGSPQEVVSKIFADFKDPEFRAYLLAMQAAEYHPELVNAFYLLPPMEAEFASLIYAIKRGMYLDADIFEFFKTTYLKDAPARVERHFADILLTEALKKKNVSAANVILSSMRATDPQTWQWLFVMKGANPNALKTIPPFSRESINTVHLLMFPGATTPFTPLQMKEKAKTVGIYYFATTRNWVTALWLTGERDDALALLRTLYSGTGKHARTVGLRTYALRTSVQFLGVVGKPDYAFEYIYANAGNSELQYDIVAEFSINAARMGNMQEAIEMMNRFNGDQARAKTTFHPPAFPEKWVDANMQK